MTPYHRRHHRPRARKTYTAMGSETYLQDSLLLEDFADGVVCSWMRYLML